MNTVLLILASAPIVAILGFGFLLGLKHATEADHLAAVSTLVLERKGLWRSSLIGGLWGIGHTISLFAAGVLVLYFDLQISESTERRLELCVGIMLAILGLNVLRKLIQGGRLHFHSHEHGERIHAHPHVHELSEHSHPAMHHSRAFSPRALVIGMVHGLAGSAALMLLVIPMIGSKAVGLLYIAVFGIGSIGGMMIMSFLVGLPFHLTSLRLTRLNWVIQGCAGVLSVGLGLWIIYEKGFSHAVYL